MIRIENMEQAVVQRRKLKTHVTEACTSHWQAQQFHSHKNIHCLIHMHFGFRRMMAMVGNRDDEQTSAPWQPFRQEASPFLMCHKNSGEGCLTEHLRRAYTVQAKMPENTWEIYWVQTWCASINCMNAVADQNMDRDRRHSQPKPCAVCLPHTTRYYCQPFYVYSVTGEPILFWLHYY